ncbi:tetratricopeptide repeat protein [Sphingomonas lutea]|uniref:Tetratricopeptide repeat protein n=1 Tax=Sphingomonas lutea TaxID=1045317 RepID=A0A7G9SFH7_9SPHN|nr:tetratricopeptide repeat protein [Sphingomonas lutea]QNN66602.1 tetratricopeptide repeat protein [Sphingomonas lutea]
MSFSLRALTALLLSAAAVPAIAQAPAAAAPAQVKPSKQALKAIAELQAATNGTDVALIKAKVAEAQAVAATKEDRYLIGQMQVKAALATNDMTLGASGLDAIAASGYLDNSKVASLYTSLGVKAYNAKNLPQAEQLFTRAAALDARNVEALSFLGEAKLAQGQKPQAVAAFQRAIQASGAQPKEALLKRALGAAYEARLPVAADIGRQWITLYPGPESWRTALAIYRNTSKPDAETTLDVLRLMRSAGALTTPADFTLYASVLTDQSNFIEAQNALDQAITAKRIDATNVQISGIAGTLKARPKPTAAELDAAAKSAQSGMALLRIGDRFYGLGDFAKAAALYKQAASKGADANLVNMRVGVALAAAGDKAGATAAFNSVTGARADLAKFWLLHLQTRA